MQDIDNYTSIRNSQILKLVGDKIKGYEKERKRELEIMVEGLKKATQNKEIYIIYNGQ